MNVKFILTFLVILLVHDLNAETVLPCYQILRELIHYERITSYKGNGISPLLETHSAAIPKQLEHSGALVSFGSGGDILNPLHTFPYLSEYHLVDVLTGWGAGPGEVVLEIRKRLEYVYGKENVIIIQKGFTQFVDESKFRPPTSGEFFDSSDKAVRAHFNFSYQYWYKWGWPKPEKYLYDPRTHEALIFEFVSENGIKKRVHLHHLDFNDDKSLAPLRRELKNQLDAIFITGAYPPESLIKFVKIMNHDSYLVIELFKDNRTEILKILRSVKGDITIFAPHVKDYNGDDVEFVHFHKK